MTAVDGVDPATANLLWRHLEPYHALVYFTPEHRQACDRAGLRGGWMAYFASRSAPLGHVPAAVVSALFYNFHPAMVARALPDAWSYTTAETILQARIGAMDVALGRVLGDQLDAPSLAEAADLAMAAADMADTAGRPMFAANRALGPPDAPHLRLWHAATMLREHRGDGHVAVLATHEVDGCQAHVLQVAAGVIDRDQLQPHRGWSDQDWDAATDGLAARGWLTREGELTDEGRHLRTEVQQRTDQLAAAPLQGLGEARARRLLAALRPLTERVVAARAIPYPNAMGVPAP